MISWQSVLHIFDVEKRQMSMAAVVKDVALIGEQLFDHTPQVRQEIEKFVDRFERNERHREFDGILRASHALVEAAETPVEALFEAGKMTKLIDDVNEITAKISALTTPKFGEEHQTYLENIKTTQKDYVELCRREALKKMRAMAETR
ncbi:unnamed protein product [Caenorhabditis auriculariae]|uniref:Biogenesis of lysosome-related organelles complex 1 subunit 5 n=1 Tax=Caenorhabditis auriculariae TaxID=2777116 RepID=A0A8S1HXH9_9PELO|nr:unnamed protein product [Caenorhabditis auriculariae]